MQEQLLFLSMPTFINFTKLMSMTQLPIKDLKKKEQG